MLLNPNMILFVRVILLCILYSKIAHLDQPFNFRDMMSLNEFSFFFAPKIHLLTSYPEDQDFY